MGFPDRISYRDCDCRGGFRHAPLFHLRALEVIDLLAIALLVFFGEDRFSYMLGMVAPILGFALNILLGGFFHEFKVLFNALTGKATPPMSTALHGLAILLEIVLVIVCYRAWHKQVTEKFFEKTFWISLAISIGYLALLVGWHFSHAI